MFLLIRRISLYLLQKAVHLEFLVVFYLDKARIRMGDRRVVAMGEETVVCKLKERRTSLGFTQRQVADGTEINVRTVINIEKGKTIPNLLYALKLAKFLGMRVEEMFEYYD